MRKSDYVRKRQEIDHAYQQMFRQYMFDIMMLTLNDPEVMGKDVFGKKRFKRISVAMDKNYHQFFDALRRHPEADYQRERLDRALRQIMGDEMVPFEKRYDCFAKIHY